MHRQPTRWAWLTLPVAILALGIAACGPATQPTAQQAPAADEKPQYGGTLVYGGLSAPSHLDVLAGGGTGDTRNSGAIYDKLVEYDYMDPNYKVDYKLVPALADRWEISPDGKTYTFFLHKGVKWQDGEGFTAADVVYTFQRIMKEKGPLFANLIDTDSVEALDPYTVKLSNRQADVTFMIRIGANNMAIQPKHLADKGVDLKKTAVGTGPFKLESFDPKTHSVWVKNPTYWKSGLPYLDKVDLIWSLDKPSLLAAVSIGKIDTTYNIEKVDLETVQRSNPNIQVFKQAYLTPVLYFNLDHPAFKDIRVRRAIHLAVDRQELIKINGKGEGTLMCYMPGYKTGWCIPGFEQLPGFRPQKEQDIAEAKRLLADAGYANGFEFNLLYSRAFTQSVPLSELFATQMARIGVKVVVDGRDTPTFNDLVNKGTYDASLNQSAAWSDTTDKTALVNFYSTKGVLNKHGVGNAELDKLIDQQAQTFDVEARKKMWYQMEQIVLDNMWAVPFTNNAQYSLVQPWIKGPTILNLDWQSMNSPRMSTTWLDLKTVPQR